MKAWTKGFAAAVLVLASVAAQAAGREDRGYLYRSRANWVKIVDATADEVPTGTIRHPYRGLTATQLENIFLAVKINRNILLKKDLKTTDVFNTYEARRVATFVVEGLAKATSGEVVNFAVVHKRPLFILRNDHISTGNVWMADDGLHIQFTKIFAQITGDYESATHLDKALRRAKTQRLTLEAAEGQKLSYNSPTEIIIDPSYDFASVVEADNAAEIAAEEADLHGGKTKQAYREPIGDEPGEVQATPRRATTAAAAPNGSAERLRRLDELKRQKLITDAEYQKLRAKILSEL